MKLKVVAGSLGGRLLDAPSGHNTHPMGERIRGALFNSLGDIVGLTVLDAYSGSGALSIEAISRGAKSAVLIDSNKQVVQTIRSNIASLGIEDQTKVTQAPILSWLGKNPELHFDLIFADPPYTQVQPAAIFELANHLLPDGLLILSWPVKKNLPELDNLTKLDEKIYADAKLAFYKKTG